MNELVAASVFIPFIIIAITQMVKMAAPAVHGWVTIGVAFVVGLVVALIDQFIGVTDINVAQGLVYALGAVGITTTFGKAGGGVKGDENRQIS